MKLVNNILEIIRYKSFWLKDLLSGSKVKKHLNEINGVLDNYSSEESIAIRRKNLDNLLEHATNFTKFYEKFKGCALEDLPVINKNMVRNHINDFESRLFAGKKNKVVKTSGSTGAILKIEHNKQKVFRNTADTIYFASKVGFKVGYRLYYVRHWLQYYKKPLLTAWFQNIRPVEVLNLNKKKTKTLIDSLKKENSNIVFLGYVSAFEQIIRNLDAVKSEPITLPNLKSIITMSESLSEHTKNKLKHYFKVPVVSRYSNMENGIIAQQGVSNNSSFEINWASYHIEVLKFDEDTPVKSGELGRIVVTDLFNYCTPLIRYDTGDIGSINFEQTPPVLTKIEGRKSDIILNTKGEVISSYIMLNTYTFEGIIQAQFIQEKEKSYTLKLNVSDNFNSEKDVIVLFKSFLGNDAQISIQYVDEIPLLSSGKRKYTINNFLKANQNTSS